MPELDEQCFTRVQQVTEQQEAAVQARGNADDESTSSFARASIDAALPIGPSIIATSLMFDETFFSRACGACVGRRL
jgi:hypothetical protein